MLVSLTLKLAKRCNMNTQNKTFSLLLWCNGLANLGHFTAYSLMAIYFLNNLHLTVETISIILLFFAIALKTSRIIFAPLINLINTRYIMFYSMIICASGYTLLGYTQSSWLIVAALLTISIGYGTNGLLIRAATSYLKSNSTLMRFAALNMVTNFAAALGPLIGNSLMLKYPQYGFCFFSASIFALGAMIVWLFPLTISHEKININQWFNGILCQFYSKRIRSTLFITVLLWLLLAQLFSLVPLYVVKGLLAQNLLGSIYLINSSIIVIFTLPIIKWIAYKKLTLYQQLLISLWLFLIGFLILTSHQNIICLYLAVIFWSLAEIISTPMLNILVINSTQKNMRLIGFAINALAMGVGEGIGNFIGVILAGYSYANNCWNLAFSLFALLIIFFIFFIFINPSHKELGIIPGEKI